MNIGGIFNKIGDMIDTKKEEMRLYNELLSNSLKFDNINQNIKNNDTSSPGRIEEITTICPGVNKEYAAIIDSLIPFNETFIFIVYSTQRIDNKNYVLVFTNKYLWIIDKNNYSIVNYDNINIFDIISKSLMTQVINLNNIILGIDTNSTTIDNIYNFIKDINYRNNIILEKTKYLCGITPIYQKLNKINSGISIDINYNIIFHDKKINNYGYRYQDILNYELLEDQTVVLKKKTMDYNHNLTSVKQTCTCITLRITLINNQVFSINILEPTTFSSTYNHNDTIYRENYNFSKEIIDKLDSLNPNLY